MRLWEKPHWGFYLLLPKRVCVSLNVFTYQPNLFPFIETTATQLTELNDFLDILVEGLYAALNPAVIMEALKTMSRVAVTCTSFPFLYQYFLLIFPLDDNQEKIAVAGAVFQLVGLLTHSNELVQFHSAAVLATLMVLTSIQLDLYRVSIYLYP